TAYVNPYKFNAKELDSETGLYYYGARYYNPRISVWYGVDPLAEQMSNWSPYVYAFQNPVNFTDPTGMKPNDWVEQKNGNIYWDKKATSQATTKKDEIYRGKTYQRERIWSNINVRGDIENGLMTENYNSNGKMTYTNQTPWIDKAFEEMSKNISETGSNPEITKYWAYTQMPEAAAKGDEWAKSVLSEDQTPWCAAFINYNLGTSGVEGTKSALAYSFKKYGQDLANGTPAYGSIAVMNYSHVGFVVGDNKDGRIILLGGNQGDAVNLSPNYKSSVIKYVYPSGKTPSSLRLPQYNLKGRSLTSATSR
ncbi:TIGR02594 family protein, partial [Chryseobacterium sp. GP-SGM7]|uniref:TIGR02594 family protein n=1 Tax=Chryseobacterium sp. GP-SGM7 TaxID=3411323 RepID=UPI003B94D8F6